LEFPNASDFDEPPISVTQAVYRHPSRTPGNLPFPPTPIRTPEILDEITVEPPPATRVFSITTQPLINSEPTSFHEAIRRPDANKWIAAMISEIDSIVENKTWSLCDLLAIRKCIGTKWVFKIKLDGNNNIKR
jgi:hypothetical protein